MSFAHRYGVPAASEYKIVREGDEWAVYEPDGSLVTTCESKAEARKEVTADRQHKKDQGE